MPDEAPALVLLVEDDADTREMYAFVLRTAGFQVLEAASAEDALDHLAKNVPVGIVSDIALPGADGFELCQQIRRMDAHRTTPIIGITAVSLVQAMMQARRAGFTQVLTKPCLPEDLVNALHESLEPAPELVSKPEPVKLEEKRQTPSERAWRIRGRRFGSE